MTDLACFLINLDRSTDRLDLATEEIKKLGRTFERISAVDGRLLDLDQYPAYSKAAALSYFGRELFPGEVACFQSHINALRQFLASDAKCALVLEDDFVVNPGGASAIEELLSRLDEASLDGWGYIDLGTPPHKLYTRVFDLGGDDGNQLCRSHYFSFGAHAILWSRSGAESALNAYLPMNAPYDLFLRAWNAQRDAGYALLHPPIGVTGLDSDIEAVTNRAHPQRRWSRIRRRMVEKPLVYWNMAKFRLKRLLAGN